MYFVFNRYSPGRNNIRKKKSPSPCLPEKLEATGLGSGDEVSDDDYVPDTSVKGRNALRQEALSSECSFFCSNFKFQVNLHKICLYLIFLGISVKHFIQMR